MVLVAVFKFGRLVLTAWPHNYAIRLARRPTVGTSVSCIALRFARCQLKAMEFYKLSLITYTHTYTRVHARVHTHKHNRNPVQLASCWHITSSRKSICWLAAGLIAHNFGRRLSLAAWGHLHCLCVCVCFNVHKKIGMKCIHMRYTLRN